MLLSDAEWKVMNHVWDRCSATARDVVDALADDTGWAYTTVKTMMSRLVQKGALQESRRGNASVYAPGVTRADARRSALHSLMDRAFDGGVQPLMHFLLEEEKLSARDKKELERLLEESKPRKRRRR